MDEIEFVKTLDEKNLNDIKKTINDIKEKYLDIEKVIEAINSKLKFGKLEEKEEQNLKRLKTALEKEEKELQKIKKVQKDIVAETLEEELALKRQETTLVKLKKSWESLSSTANIVSNFLGSVSSIDLSKLVPTTLWRDNAKNLIDMEDAAYRMSQRAGKGPEGIKELKNTYIDIQAKLKDSAENAREITKTLSETGYVKNLGEAAEYISLFSRTTGTSIGQTTDVMNNLTKIGKFSSKEAGTMLANVARIQKLNGITTEGMNAWASSVKSVTNNMKAFGQSDESIKKMVVSTAKLVSSLEKVGVSAQQATQWIEDLTDPGNIEKNIGLYSQLGISISDALSGNIDGDTIGAGLKDFGQKIKEMGPIAGKAYADAFGISYKEAIKAADMKVAIDAGEITEQDSKSELEKMKEETLSFNQMQKENINQMIGETQKLMSNLTQKQLMLTSIVVSYAMYSVPKIFNKMIDNQEKYDKNRIFKEEKFQALIISGKKEAAEEYLKATIEAYKEILEYEGTTAAKSPFIKQKIKEAKEMSGIIEGMYESLQNNSPIKELSDNMKQQLNNLIKELKGSFDNVNIGLDTDDIKASIDAIKERITEAENLSRDQKEALKDQLNLLTQVNNSIDKLGNTSNNTIENQKEALKECSDLLTKTNNSMDELENTSNNMFDGYKKALEKYMSDLGGANKHLDDLKNSSKLFSSNLNMSAKNACESINKVSMFSSKNLKAGGKSVGKALNKSSKIFLKNLKAGGKSVGKALNKSSKIFLKNLIRGGNRAGKQLEIYSKRAASNLKAGAIAAKIPLAAIGIGLYRAADKMWGITDKIANWLKSLGGFGKFIGNFFDLDMDDNKEAVEKNTEELSKNNEIKEEENKPSQIYINKATKDVSIKNGIKSVGDITNEETKDVSIKNGIKSVGDITNKETKTTSSINRTTNSNFANNSTDRSSEIVSALQEQIRIAVNNGASVNQIIKELQEMNNRTVNQIIVNTNAKSAEFTDTDKTLG